MTNKKQRELIVVKKPAYVWRVHSWGLGENFNHIPCWYVIDKNTDEIIAGGYHSGSNVQSGRAFIPRKKDAKAFIDGYLSAKEAANPHSEFERGFEAIGNYRIPTNKRVFKGADDETEAFWDEGHDYIERGTLSHFSSLP